MRAFINSRMVFRILGVLLFIEAGLMLLCSFFPIYYHEDDLTAFLLSAVAAVGVGMFLFLLGKGADKRFNRREGYIVVSVSWVIFSIFGMLPYCLSGYIPNLSDAFFETMSGFTTTGASVVDDIEGLPHGILFWRSMTQWIGGLGIVFFTIAVLPVFGVGGVQLFAAEATGPKHDKVHPRIEVTAKWIWSIYLGLTVVETCLLSFGGMGWFDSVCHSLSTTATGGYSTRQASIAAYNSPFIEYVVIIFMFLSGINFTLLFLVLMKGRMKKLFIDTEFRLYVGLVVSFTLLIAAGLLLTHNVGDVELAFRQALFQVVSIMTTTGYVSVNYTLWHPLLWFLLTLLMFTGACAGSTSGSIKCIRIAMLFKVAQREFKRIVHPNAVIPVRISREVIVPRTKVILLAFIVVYIGLIFLGWAFMLALGLDFAEAYGVVVSSLGNVGPAIGRYGADASWSSLPEAAKWVSTLLMLIGRLELFSVLLLFTPSFWKKR